MTTRNRTSTERTTSGGEATADGRAAARGRGGRPPASRAGDVDARILDAARALFLTRGYDGTSCDLVVEHARAGKASLYARYADKAALLAAVLHREAAHDARAAERVPLDLPVRARLTATGLALIDEALAPETLALARLLIAEAGRFPDLAAHVAATGRARSTRRIAAAIVGRTATEADAPTGAALERATGPAATFFDAVVPPIQLRALLGDDLAALRAGAAAQVEAATALLIAAGTLDGQS